MSFWKRLGYSTAIILLNWAALLLLTDLNHVPFWRIVVALTIFDLSSMLGEWVRKKVKLAKRVTSRDPKRIDVVLEKLKMVWEENPDLRLGQLVENLAKKNKVDVWNVEENEIEQSIEQVLSNGWS